MSSLPVPGHTVPDAVPDAVPDDEGRWRSLLSRCGPLSLLGASVVLLVGAFGVDDLRSGLAGLLAVIVLVAASGGLVVPPVRLIPAAVAFLSVGWSNWLLSADRSLEPALVAGLRVLVFVYPGLVFASYLDPFTVGDHFGQRLRLPARPVLAFVAALQRLESLGDDWDELARARRARGLGPGRGPVSRARHAGAMMFALLVHAIRMAGRVTVAMEARGYSSAAVTGGRRTWAVSAPWTGADTALVVATVLAGAVPWVVAMAG